MKQAGDGSDDQSIALVFFQSGQFNIVNQDLVSEPHFHAYWSLIKGRWEKIGPKGIEKMDGHAGWDHLTILILNIQPDVQPLD